MDSWGGMTQSPLGPAVTISTGVHLGLTVAFVVVFAVLFLVIFLEMLLLLYYKHKLFSYQSVFLFVCLIWSALRVELFTVYFNRDSQDDHRGVVSTLPVGWYFMLYVLPVVLQYMTLTLLVLYFSRVWLKVKERGDLYSARRYYDKARIALYVVWTSLILVLLTVNMVVSFVAKRDAVTQSCEGVHDNSTNSTSTTLIHSRVVVTEFIFLLNACALGYFVYKVYRSPSANTMLETQGTSVLRATSLALLLMVLFLSRAVFNFVISASDFPCRSSARSWFYASDEGDVGGDMGSHYVTFVCCLFFWELLPTVAIIFFFRIRQTSLPSTPSLSQDSDSASQARFFDNPKRYDSDADEDQPGPLPAFRFTGYPVPPVINPVYGSINPVPSSLPSPAYASSSHGTPTYEYRVGSGPGYY